MDEKPVIKKILNFLEIEEVISVATHEILTDFVAPTEPKKENAPKDTKVTIETKTAQVQNQ